MTVVFPTGNIFPAGTPVRVTVTPGQLSLAVALPSVASLTNVPQEDAPGPVNAVTLLGAVIVGGIAGLSSTVTVCVFTVVFPDASLAVYVMIVTPVGKMKFAGTPVREMLTAEQVSDAVAMPSSSSSTTEQELVVVFIGPGTSRVGGVVSPAAAVT